MEIARIVYMSSVGSDNAVFWAACDTSSDAVVARLLIVSLSRVRFREPEMMRVDVLAITRRGNTRTAILADRRRGKVKSRIQAESHKGGGDDSEAFLGDCARDPKTLPSQD